MVRNPDQIANLKSTGVEVVLGDLNDAASLKRALEGSSAAIHVGPPLESAEAEFAGAMIEACKINGVKRLIFFSVMHPHLADLHHHRCKLKAEEAIINSGIDYTILQPARYMQNLEMIWPDVRKSGHTTPFGTASPLSVVDLLDGAEVAAIAATQPGHSFATYQLAGPQILTSDEMAAKLGMALGRVVTARSITPKQQSERFRVRGMPTRRIEWLEAMNRHYDEHGFVGNSNILAAILKRKAARFEDYAARLIAADAVD